MSQTKAQLVSGLSINASAPATSLNIDSSGRVLVGTSTSLAGAFSDQGLFQTVKADGAAGYTSWRFTNDDGGAIIYLNKSRSGTAGTNTIVQNNDILGSINFAGADGSTYHRGALIRAEVDGTPGTNDMPGRLVFSTTADGASSPTERMRILSGGSVIVAGTSVGAAGSISLRSDGYFQAPAIYGFAVSVSTRAMYMDNQGFLGYITSTRESKANIAPQESVDWLYQLEPVAFNYKTKDRETDQYTGVDPQLQFGLIAEDVEPVCPELCFYDETENGKELRGVQYEKLITPMLKALQQANARIETLEAEVAALKGA